MAHTVPAQRSTRDRESPSAIARHRCTGHEMGKLPRPRRNCSAVMGLKPAPADLVRHILLPRPIAQPSARDPRYDCRDRCTEIRSRPMPWRGHVECDLHRGRRCASQEPRRSADATSSVGPCQARSGNGASRSLERSPARLSRPCGPASSLPTSRCSRHPPGPPSRSTGWTRPTPGTR